MAIINRSLHAHANQRRNVQGHNVVRAILPRQSVGVNPEGVTIAPTSLPVSTKVLIAFFVVLGAVIVGIITWRVVAWKRRKALPASQKYRQGSFMPSEKVRPIMDGTPMEKQEVLVILPIEPPRTAQPESGKWTPQIFSHRTDNAANVFDVKSPPANEIRSPPPTYTASGSPSSTPSSSPRPPALNLPVVTINHQDSDLLLSVPPVSAVPSPRRTSSFGMEGLGNGETNLKAKPSMKGQKLPRKMLVEHTFIPSLADELAIKVGEVLNMLEEYEDEWCLVERIGSRAGERGVVPRFCMKERPRGHKRGMSSASARSAATVSSRAQ